MIKTDNVHWALHNTRAEFLRLGREVDRGEWQAMRDDRPQTKVFEIHDISFRVVVPPFVTSWQKECEPNLPWAEDHFQERILPDPDNMNPGDQYKNWPWYQQGVEEHKQPGEFSHTYMERFWPLTAGLGDGIRSRAGDLQDLITLLKQRPFTRQAYLPIWFPEDLAMSLNGQRVPCTLGYHFLAYPGTDKPQLRVTYYMRSCDWFRYLRDDLYMAGRLLQHVAERVDMDPTMVTMHIANLHIFAPEVERLQMEHDRAEKERMSRVSL